MTHNATFLYLCKRYLETKWPYYGMRETKFNVGASFDSDIKELREAKMIQPVAGFNGWLIEILLINEKWLTI